MFYKTNFSLYHFELSRYLSFDTLCQHTLPAFRQENTGRQFSNAKIFSALVSWLFFNLRLFCNACMEKKLTFAGMAVSEQDVSMDELLDAMEQEERRRREMLRLPFECRFGDVERGKMVLGEVLV